MSELFSTFLDKKDGEIGYWETNRAKLFAKVLRGIKATENIILKNDGQPLHVELQPLESDEQPDIFTIDYQFMDGMKRVAYSLFLDLVDSGERDLGEDIINTKNIRYMKPHFREWDQS